MGSNGADADAESLGNLARRTEVDQRLGDPRFGLRERKLIRKTTLLQVECLSDQHQSNANKLLIAQVGRKGIEDQIGIAAPVRQIRRTPSVPACESARRKCSWPIASSKRRNPSRMLSARLEAMAACAASFNQRTRKSELTTSLGKGTRESHRWQLTIEPIASSTTLRADFATPAELTANSPLNLDIPIFTIFLQPNDLPKSMC